MSGFIAVITEYYSKIHDIPVLFCALAAIIIPFLVIAVGFLIKLFSDVIGQMISLALAPIVSYAIINYAFFPGVMVHELSHAFMAFITGCKVSEVALFKKDEESGSLGHVTFRNRGNVILVALQNVLSSSAPMFIGGAACFGCFFSIYHLVDYPSWFKLILGYLGVSIFFHMTMSTADIKVYIKGVPLLMALLFIIAVPLRLTGVT